MEKDIFAPYEIAKQLKELGFDEPCIAFYYYKRLVLTRKKATDIAESDDIIKVPTWEQVFKWFREKEYFGMTQEKVGRKEYYFIIKIKNKGFYVDETNYLIYEQCREALALELIEIYKKEQDNG